MQFLPPITPPLIRLRKSIQLAGRCLMPSVLDRDKIDHPEDTDWEPDHPEDYCPRCGQTIGPYAAIAHGCASCYKQHFHWDRMIRLGPYQSPLDRRIKSLKFHHTWKWADYLGKQLATALPQPQPGHAIYITSVPLHRNRRLKRGYNQSELIAQRIAKQRHFRYRNLLKRTKDTLPQSSLPPSKRAANVSGAFSLIHPNLDLENAHIIIIDDVKTSGSTLTQCAKLLRKANPLTITAAVIAVASPNHHQPSDDDYADIHRAIHA